MEAWKNKEKREAARMANLQLTIAASAGVKIHGRRPLLSDFLPDFAKPKRRQRSAEEIEADLKAAFRKVANHTNPTHGQK